MEDRKVKVCLISMYLQVPPERFNGTVGTQFTMMMWMKHASDSERDGQKEQLICNADGEGKWHFIGILWM